MNSQEYNEQMRLSEAKQMRKRAEEDALLLANRISLLKQEELKAMKKIEETRRKAQEILSARNRNLEEAKKREEIKRQRENDEELRIQQIKQLRDQKKSVREQANNYKFTKSYLDSQAMKSLKLQNIKNIEDMRSEEMAQKIHMKNLVKRQHEEAEEKRKRMFEERKEKARLEHEKKIQEVNRLRREREDEIIRMEQEELDLMQRLQNTQVLQKNAYEDLENALRGPYEYCNS